MANLPAGEFGVSFEGEEYTFRPSFYALAQIGGAQDLASALQRIQNRNKSGFACALHVLSVCCDKDASRLLGYYKDLRGELKYVAGRLPMSDIWTLGVKLLVNGVVGDPEVNRKLKPVKEESARQDSGFDPAEFAASAMAHLSLSGEDAWSMTLKEFQRAMMMKFPQAFADIPTREEYKDTVARVKRIRELAKK